MPSNTYLIDFNFLENFDKFFISCNNLTEKIAKL